MALDQHKELTPVLYDSSGLKIVRFHNWMQNMLLCNLHWHDRFELIYVKNGELRFRLNNHELVVSAGQIAIIPPKAMHYAMIETDGFTAVTLMFDVDAFYGNIPLAEQHMKPILEQKVSFVPATDHPDILRLVDSVITDVSIDSAHASLFRIGKVYELLGLLYQHCLEEEAVPTTTLNQFQDVLDYINQHFDEDISSENLSKRFGYSEAYFCRQFKTVTGLSPMIYIRILRLEKARELLKKERYSFQEIAVRCGFGNANYFTRYFKSQFNLTPSEYIGQRKKQSK